MNVEATQDRATDRTRERIRTVRLLGQLETESHLIGMEVEALKRYRDAAVALEAFGYAIAVPKKRSDEQRRIARFHAMTDAEMKMLGIREESA